MSARLARRCVPGCLRLERWTSRKRSAPADPLLQAMRDEMDRARKLKLPNLEAPYFVEYMIDESESFSVTASLGGLLSRRQRTVPRARGPGARGRLQVRQHQLRRRRFGGGSRYDLERFPLDNAYPVLRRYFWLRRIRHIRARWKPSRASGRPCAISSRASSSTISRTPSRCKSVRPIPSAVDGRRPVDRPRAESFGDFRQVSRRQELRRGTGRRATAATTW